MFLPNTNSDENFKFNYALKLGEYIIANGFAKISGSGAVAAPIINNDPVDMATYGTHNVATYTYNSANSSFTKDDGKSTSHASPKEYTINIFKDGDSYHLLPIYCDDSIAGGGKSKSKSKKVSYKKLYHKNKEMLKKLKNI